MRLRNFATFLIFTCALAAGQVEAQLKNQWIEYTHGDARLKGYLVWDDKASGKRPAVLMIHARDGMSPKNLKLAETWAGMGYVTFMADIFGYGEGILPKEVPDMQALTAIYTKDRPMGCCDFGIDQALMRFCTEYQIGLVLTLYGCHVDNLG